MHSKNFIMQLIITDTNILNTRVEKGAKGSNFRHLVAFR